MKHIIKGDEPPKLYDWKAQANENWKPTWDNFSGEPKQATKTALVKEQGYICCYCMKRIDEQASHIEHIIPRSVSGTNEAQKLDYSNMLASCQGEDKEDNSPENIGNGTKVKTQQLCGHFRENWYDPVLYISPLETSCEPRFRYYDDGKIKPAPGDLGAETTIKKLRLDYSLLEKNRKKAILGVIPDELTVDDLRLLLRRYGERNAEGKFREYCGAIIQVIKQQI